MALDNNFFLTFTTIGLLFLARILKEILKQPKTKIFLRNNGLVFKIIGLGIVSITLLLLFSFIDHNVQSEPYLQLALLETSIGILVAFWAYGFQAAFPKLVSNKSIGYTLFISVLIIIAFVVMLSFEQLIGVSSQIVYEIIGGIVGAWIIYLFTEVAFNRNTSRISR